MRTLTSTVFAATIAAALAAVPGPSRAQLVPRLVDYPVTRTSACAVDASTQLVERHRIVYAKDGRRDDVQVFAQPGCTDATLLFTISVARSLTAITPTAAGVAYLHDRCGAYSWEAGRQQDVTSNPCSFVSPTLSSL